MSSAIISGEGHWTDQTAKPTPRGYEYRSGSITLDGMHIASVTGNAEAVRELIRKANAAVGVAGALTAVLFHFVRASRARELTVDEELAIDCATSALARYRGEA